MDCSATVFLDVFLNFFTGAWSPQFCHLQLTLDWPGNMNVIQKPLSSLKNVLQKPHEVFQGVLVVDVLSFMQNLRQTCCLILPSIADKTEQKEENVLM
jgi:hypothetical protein